MIIPSIILFGAIGLGLSMIPAIWRDGIECIKEVLMGEDD
jgi:hypothetical protein